MRIIRLFKKTKQKGRLMENISPEDKSKITGLISVLIPKAKIILFGSRARGTNAERSDIDIAVDSGIPLSHLAVDEIKSMLQASNIMYKIDVVDFNNVSENMRKLILHDGIVWKS